MGSLTSPTPGQGHLCSGQICSPLGKRSNVSSSVSPISKAEDTTTASVCLCDTGCLSCRSKGSESHKSSFLSFSCLFLSFPPDFRGPFFCHGPAGTMSVGQQGWERVLSVKDELSVNHSKLMGVPCAHETVWEGCAALHTSCFAMSPGGMCFQILT